MTEQVKNEKIKKRKYFPTSFTVILGLIILFVIISWIGNAVNPDNITKAGILDVFPLIWRGFKSKIDVIIFIFSIGGTLGIMTKIKAIDAGISALVRKLGDKVWLLIPALMLIFGLGGTTYGMWEETIAFIPILVPVFKKAGYGPFVAIFVILAGAGIGCLASTINPFAVGSAVSAIKDEKIVFDSSVLQGARWLSWVLFEIVGITFVSLLANRYRKANLAKLTTNVQVKEYQKDKGFLGFFTGPKVVEGIDNKLIDSRFQKSENLEFTLKRKISLGLFISSFILMILMYLPWGLILSDSAKNSSISNFDSKMSWFASTTKWIDLENKKLDIKDGKYLGIGFSELGDWYFTSVAAIFLIFTFIIFAINFKEFRSSEENPEQGFISTYLDGIKDVIGVCLIIGLAGGLGMILGHTKIGSLIAKESSKGINNLVVYGVVVFLISIFLSILVPSTSGFASAFMGIFAKLATEAFPAEMQKVAVGIAIFGFIFANGLANFVSPTSATLMGYTAYAGVPYQVWLKQTWKLTLTLFFVSLFLILIFSYAASTGSQLF